MLKSRYIKLCLAAQVLLLGLYAVPYLIEQQHCRCLCGDHPNILHSIYSQMATNMPTALFALLPLIMLFALLFIRNEKLRGLLGTIVSIIGFIACIFVMNYPFIAWRWYEPAIGYWLITIAWLFLSALWIFEYYKSCKNGNLPLATHDTNHG